MRWLDIICIASAVSSVYLVMCPWDRRRLCHLTTMESRNSINELVSITDRFWLAIVLAEATIKFVCDLFVENAMLNMRNF